MDSPGPEMVTEPQIDIRGPGLTSHNVPGHLTGHWHTSHPGYHQIKWSSHPLFVTDLNSSYTFLVFYILERATRKRLYFYGRSSE